MKLIHKIIICVLSAVLIFSGVMIYKEKSEIKKAENEYKELEQIFTPIETETPTTNSESVENSNSETEKKPVANQRIELSKLKEINPDAVGWILIPDTLVSYPVVQGDTQYYLKHTFKGAYSNAGSIFLEELNSADMTDPHLIIYGHNMYSYGMFTDLENYVDYDFWNDHQYIYIWNESGKHTYQVFSCYTAYDNDAAYSVGYSHDDTFKALIDYMIENSRYQTNVNVTSADNVLTLSTCYNNGNIRYLVHAVEIL